MTEQKQEKELLAISSGDAAQLSQAQDDQPRPAAVGSQGRAALTAEVLPGGL